jgi:hypothetical protein
MSKRVTAAAAKKGRGEEVPEAQGQRRARGGCPRVGGRRRATRLPQSRLASHRAARRQEPAPRGHRPARAVRDHHGVRRPDGGDGERARRHVGGDSERGAPRMDQAGRLSKACVASADGSAEHVRTRPQAIVFKLKGRRAAELILRNATLGEGIGQPVNSFARSYRPTT